MKKTIFAIALVLMVVLAMGACRSLTLPVEITDNPVGSKIGESSAKFLFGLPMMALSGDMGLSTAAANGGISKIATVERRIARNPFITTITTIVTGN